MLRVITDSFQLIAMNLQPLQYLLIETGKNVALVNRKTTPKLRSVIQRQKLDQRLEVSIQTDLQ